MFYMRDIQTFIFYAKAMKCCVVNGEPWFRAEDVAAILEYNDTKKAIANNVDNDEQSIYIFSRL